MPLFHPSALTIVAVLITEPMSVLPPALTAGLTVFCAIGGTFALLGGFRRDGAKRHDDLDRMSPAAVVPAHSAHPAHRASTGRAA